MVVLSFGRHALSDVIMATASSGLLETCVTTPHFTPLHTVTLFVNVVLECSAFSMWTIHELPLISPRCKWPTCICARADLDLPIRLLLFEV
jgi:hypothetical protein